MELYRRIRFLRESLGITQDDLAKQLGYKSRSTIAKIEAGENDIPQSKIVDFAQALKTTPAYLMGWEDSPTDFDIFSHPDIMPIETYRIPLLGSVSCGEPTYEEEDFEGYVDVGTQVKADYAIRAKGDSMIGARILDGDIVLVRQQPTVENGEIAVVSIDDEITLKRFRQAGRVVLLIPDNPAYETIEVDLENNDTVRILGKAVAFQSDVR